MLTVEIAGEAPNGGFAPTGQKITMSLGAIEWFEPLMGNSRDVTMLKLEGRAPLGVLVSFDSFAKSIQRADPNALVLSRLR